MNKTLIAGIVGIVLLAALVIGVSAYGMNAGHGYNNGFGGQARGQGAVGADTGACPYHAQMQQVLETGTYDDLVKLRESSGRPMMPSVTDEQTFQQMQERHAQMESDGAAAGAGCAMMGARASRATGGMMRHGGNCPMMNSDDS